VKLSGINIENFGPFADREFSELSGQLTLLHGPNEAGKSAIRAFLRSVLFGYANNADRAAVRNLFQYRHFKPEAAAGSISLLSSNESAYDVHRRDGKRRGEVTVSGHETGGDDVLKRLLGGIDADLYTNVFSISLSELQEIESLNSDEIRDKIYSVGLGLANVSLTDARSRIDKELGIYLKPRSGSIRTLEKQLIEAKSQLEEIRRNSDQYTELSNGLEQLAEQIDVQTADLEEMRSSIERQKTLVSLRQPWDRKIEVERQISELPDNASMPEDAIQQLESLVEQKNELQNQLENGDLKQQERKSEYDSEGVVPAFGEKADEIHSLIMETAHYNKAVTDLPGIEKQLDEEQAHLDRDLAVIGWSEEAVSKFETPLDLQANLDSTGVELTKARRTYQEAELAVESRTKDRTTMADEAMKLANARDALTGVPTETSADLEKRRDRLSRLRAAIAEEGSIRTELGEAQNKLTETLAQTETEQIGGFVGSILMPVVVVIIGIASMAWSYMSGELSGALAGFLAVSAGMLLIVRARAAGGFKITIKKPEIGEAKDIVNNQVEEVKLRQERVKAEIAAIAKEFGMSEEPNIRDIEEKAGELDRSLDLRRRFESISREFDTAAARLSAIDVRLTESHTDLALASNTLAEVQNRWQLLLERAELRIDLDPAQAATVMASIRILKAQQKATAELRARVSQMSDAVGEIEFRLSEVLEAAALPDLPEPKPMQAVPVLESLATRWRDHDRAVERQSQITREMETWEVERATLINRMEEVDGGLWMLLETGETEDHEQFKALAAQVRERRDLERKLSELLENNPLLSNEDGESYRNDLQSTPHEDAVARMQQLEDDEKRLREQINGLHSEQGDLRRQQTEFEKSGQALELHSKINVLQEKLDSDANRWAMLTIAKHIFESTREEFQKDRQPAMMQAASRYFKKLTAGRYTAVRAVIGEKDQDLEVVEGEAHTKRAGELSRGTAEQLFLAMRFALIEEYAKNAEPMPVILDDILVNFDPDRAKAASQAIMDLSERFQILFLTCHPSTVEMFQGLAPSSESMKVVEMGSSDPNARLSLVDTA